MANTLYSCAREFSVLSSGMQQKKTDPTRDTKTKLKVLLKAEPELAPTKMASRLGVTSARVRGLAKEMNRKWVVKGRWGKL